MTRADSAMPSSTTAATTPVIAIDGPAAAGKGTLARRLARSLGLPYLDTGLLYRAVGRRVLDGSGDPTDPATAEAAALRLVPSDLDRTDLRGPAADAASSSVAAVPGVRSALLAFQRDFAQQRGAVLDGRDIGTAIFPDAPVKLFVTASLSERARRRWQELRDRGEEVAFARVEADMQARDERDSARSAAPLRAADDAVVLDTTHLNADDAYAAALRAVHDRLPALSPRR
jgi:cytidylate kinase